MIGDKPPEAKVYEQLLSACSKPGDFSPCFTELQKKFVKRCPAKLKNLLRLVKHWYKEVRGCQLAQHPPGTPLASSHPCPHLLSSSC